MSSLQGQTKDTKPSQKDAAMVELMDAYCKGLTGNP